MGSNFWGARRIITVYQRIRKKPKPAAALVYERISYARFASDGLLDQSDHDQSTISGAAVGSMNNTIYIRLDTYFDAPKIYQLRLLSVNYGTLSSSITLRL